MVRPGPHPEYHEPRRHRALSSQQITCRPHPPEHVRVMSGQQEGRGDQSRARRSGQGGKGKPPRPAARGGNKSRSTGDRRAGAPKNGRGGPRPDRNGGDPKRQDGRPGRRPDGRGAAQRPRSSGSSGRRDGDDRKRPFRRDGEGSERAKYPRRDKPYGSGEDRRDSSGRPPRAGAKGRSQRGGPAKPGRRGDWGKGGDRDRDRNRSGPRGGYKKDRSEGGKSDRGPRKADRADRAGGSPERSGVRKVADNRQRTDRSLDPQLPEEVTAEQLDPEAWAGLRSLPKDLAIVVARHLVMAGRLLDEDPERAYLYAKTARRLGSRVAVVREGCGIAAYQAGHWAEALAELRAARRLSGREAYLPIMADCERGLGRPERALTLARSAEAERLQQAERVEMRIVESGARRDMGQYDAAVLALQIAELKEQRLRPWSARLLYAYADALSAAGRDDEAGEWFAKAAAADRDGETDAAERYAEIEGLEILDAEDFLEELQEGALAQDAAKAPSDDIDRPATPDTATPDTAAAGRDDAPGPAADAAEMAAPDAAPEAEASGRDES